MRIVVDQNMPNVEPLFSTFGEVVLLPGREISAADVWEADALLVRSVTRVDESLLAGSRVRFVGSATIGTDHIDQAYLRGQGIEFAYSPGCNADSVVQYDLSVFCRLRPDWRERCVGIIGCGNVGGRLYNRLKKLGVRCRVYDPFLSLQQIPDLVDFAQVLQADILCLHTPLTCEGLFPTQHMFSASQLTALKPGTLLLNAGRGGVIDNQALLDCLSRGQALEVALDVWEGEPAINTLLMDRVALATPHIAGYSLEGRQNGSRMVYNAFCRWQGVEPAASAGGDLMQATSMQASTLNEMILASYDVAGDDRRMRAAMAEAAAQGASVSEVFDALRKGYPQRREFSYYPVEAQAQLAEDLQILGFPAGG